MVSPTQDFNFSIDIFYLILSKASATAQLTRRSTESGQTGGPGRQTAQRSAPDPQYREVFLGGLKLKLELSPLFLAQAAHTNISYICYEVPFMQFINKLSHVYCVCQLYTCYSAVKLYSTHALLYLHPPKVVFVISTDPHSCNSSPPLHTTHMQHAVQYSYTVQHVLCLALVCYPLISGPWPLEAATAFYSLAKTGPPLSSASEAFLPQNFQQRSGCATCVR